MTPPPLTAKKADKGFRPYLHLLAYGVPSAFFVIFASIILLPKVEQIWKVAGARVSKAEWVIGLCHTFVDNFNFIIIAIILFFIALENLWPGWQAVRRPVIKVIAWLVTFSVMSCMTWLCVTTCLALPAILAKPAQDGQAVAPSK